MDPMLELLLARAFRRAPAREANLAIQQVRESEGDRVRNFELVARPECGRDWLEKQVLPKLVYHLESLGIRPPGYPGIFLSIFLGEELYFLRTRELMEFAGELLHLDADEMYARWGTGELRRPIALKPDEAHPILALPAGKPE